MKRLWIVPLLLAFPGIVNAADKKLVEDLQNLNGNVIVLGTVRQPPLAPMILRDVEARLRAANRADRLAWDAIKTRTDWETYRDASLKALRQSLGQFPPAPKELKSRVTGGFEGEGYRVENIVFESRPGVIVTANLYHPAKPAASMPAMLLCHSHQSSKHTTHRQDMAMTWARAGFLVLVPDHLGHGERRQHPFGGEGPHDYHFRYDSGVQLNLAGDSLMGWLVWDMMRSIDFLLAQKGVDAKRFVLVSEPAGGGDVAGVVAALDPRVTVAMVQNFGGPEPENAYPLARDADDSLDLIGTGSWESTRNLHRSARDGFLSWAIVASIAPRKLIYFHEFYWDKDRDPVWKRLQKVYGFYRAEDDLVGLSGKGFVVGSSPENSHWLAINRETLYPVFERWLGVPNPKTEYSKRRPLEDFNALTPALGKEWHAQPLHVLAEKLAAERMAQARARRAGLTPAANRQKLRNDWTGLLGDVTPAGEPVVKGWREPSQDLGAATVERIHPSPEPGIVVPMLLLLPANTKGAKSPVVVAVSQQGKQEFLRQRAETIADLLANGVAVCLPDVRGTGETSPSAARDRSSASSSISSSELMLGQSLLGARLRDLRSALKYIRTHPQLDAARIAVWGDSFAEVNPPNAKLDVPHIAADRPTSPEPLGGLLALLAGLYEDDVRAVAIRGGLSDYQSVLGSSFCYLPYDVVIPGLLTVGDLSDIAAAIAPRGVRLEALVDGQNRALSTAEVVRRYEPARAAFAASKAADRLQLDGDAPSLAMWLSEQLQRRK